MWEADADNLFESSSTPAPFPGHTSQRVVSSGLQAEDLEQDRNLRPKTLDEYLGQERVKSNLRVLIEAAKSRNEPLDHVIFSGPPGLGKTTARDRKSTRLNSSH